MQRNKLIHIKMTPVEVVRLRTWADTQDRTMTSVIRQALDQYGRLHGLLGDREIIHFSDGKDAAAGAAPERVRANGPPPTPAV